MQVYTKHLLSSLFIFWCTTLLWGQSDSICINEVISVELPVELITSSTFYYKNAEELKEKKNRTISFPLKKETRAFDIQQLEDTLVFFYIGRTSNELTRVLFTPNYTLINQETYQGLNLIKGGDVKLFSDNSGSYLSIHHNTNQLEIFKFEKSYTSNFKKISTIEIGNDFSKLDISQNDKGTLIGFSNFFEKKNEIISFGTNIQESLKNSDYSIINLGNFPETGATDIKISQTNNTIYIFHILFGGKIIVSQLNNDLSLLHTVTLSSTINENLRSIEILPFGDSLIGYLGSLGGKTHQFIYSKNNIRLIQNITPKENGSLFDLAIINNHNIPQLINVNQSSLTLNSYNLLSNHLTPSNNSSINVNYSSTGTKEILIYNQFQSLVKNIFVKSDTTPVISFKQNEACISLPTSFTPLTNNPNITTWNWSFGDDSSSTIQNPSHQYASAGEYIVSLNVEDDNECKNSIYDTIQIYAPTTPNFTFPNPICTNNEINFTNTSSGETSDIVQWKWYEDNIKKDTLKTYITTYQESDTLNISLVAEIPGCKDSVSQEIIIAKGPQIKLSVNEKCLNDSTQFTNLTTGENITGYKWYFGNGDSSLLTSPSVLFDTVKTFNIRLEASNQAGCNNSLDTTYQIHPLPTIDFDNGLNCSNTTTEFYNRSSIPTDSIRSYTWKLNNDSVSSDKDPQIVMVNSGTNFIKLISESSFGCKDSLTKALTTIQSPQITIDTEEDCFGKPTKFSDNSTNIATITERNWSIKDLEPTSISTTFSHTFENADTFTVYLSLTSSTGCSSLDSTTINIAPLPQPTFITSQLCLDDSVQFINTSQVIGGDSIKSVRWFFESAGFEQGDSVNVKFSQQGTENIIVELLTKNGCSSNTSSSVEILQSANADFTLNKNIGTAPLTVQATSLENNNTHTWIIANNDTLRTENITTTYDTNNTYQLIHITQNSDGCIDSVTKSIIVGDHLFDLAIQGVGIKDSVNNSYITVLLHNYSPFPISAPALDIDINNEIKLHTTINTTLPPNTSTSMDIPIGISSNNLNNSNYICVAIDTNSIQDFVNDNNELCLSLNEKIDISMPMPNPTTDYINFNIYSPNDQSAEITIYNTLGNKIKSHSVQLNVGNNTITEDLINFSNEIYIIDVNSNNIHQKFTITKY